VRGSPLLYHSQDLAAGVAASLGADWKVELVMRYGKPTIADGLGALIAANVDRIVVLPLFPQHAMSSTETAVERVTELAATHAGAPPLVFVPAFFAEPSFLDAFAAVGAPALEAARPDHVLFSFHGLPVRQIQKTDATHGHCFSAPTCCDTLTSKNCYRAQCYATARALAERLHLAADRYTVCFQSRLGRTPWIQPFTDVVLDELAAKGVKRLAVLCPAFVADCLETVEEIGLRAKAQFTAAGGDELVLVPSLNSSPGWIASVAAIARRHAG
jgi:ferrochelatase